MASLLNGSRAGPVSLILLFFLSSYYYLLTTLYYFLPFRTGFGPSLFLANNPLAFLECSCTSSSLFLFLSYSTILWSIVLSSACRDDHVLERKAKRLCSSLRTSWRDTIHERVYALRSGVPESSSPRATFDRLHICCRQPVPTKIELIRFERVGFRDPRATTVLFRHRVDIILSFSYSLLSPILTG